MIQDLVIKLNEVDGKLVARGSVMEFPPMLYVGLKQLHPKTNFSERATIEEVEPLGYGVFEWALKPDLPYNKSADDEGVLQGEDGIWRPTFIVRDATEEEISERKAILEASARHRRYAELRHSDFIFSVDVPASISSNMQAWLDYRTALRNIPTQPNFPVDIVWPSRPVSLDF